MPVVEEVAFAVTSGAMMTLVAVLAALAVETAAPEPQVGPEGRVPAWVEQERNAGPDDAATASRSGAEG
jgi:hypothetical protein